jgi:hypothetical protein
MSNGVTSSPKHARAARGEDYLGPACVNEVHGQKVLVELPDGSAVEATVALAFLYEPAAGDVLLVIGRGEAYYAIGVLHGAGRAVLAFQGDVDLRAVGGALRLSGDTGISLEAPSIEAQAGKIRAIADTMVATVSSLYQRVSELFSLHAREAHTQVDESATTVAKSASILTEETMTINGKQIHLG